MDAAFKRYADPLALMTGYIQTGRFHEFVKCFFEQKKEDDLYEFYLHRVWNKTYQEYKDELQQTQELQNMSEYTMETTLKNSMNILGHFVPKEEEGD